MISFFYVNYVSGTSSSIYLQDTREEGSGRLITTKDFYMVANFDYNGFIANRLLWFMRYKVLVGVCLCYLRTPNYMSFVIMDNPDIFLTALGLFYQRNG